MHNSEERSMTCSFIRGGNEYFEQEFIDNTSKERHDHC